MDISHISGGRRLKGETQAAGAKNAGLPLLAAEGRSVVENTVLIDRGYERLETILNHLGADVVRVQEE